jgi:hypothetical protein
MSDDKLVALLQATKPLEDISLYSRTPAGELYALQKRVQQRAFDFFNEYRSVSAFDIWKNAQHEPHRTKQYLLALFANRYSNKDIWFSIALEKTKAEKRSNADGEAGKLAVACWKIAESLISEMQSAIIQDRLSDLAEEEGAFPLDAILLRCLSGFKNNTPLQEFRTKAQARRSRGDGEWILWEPSETSEHPPWVKWVINVVWVHLLPSLEESYRKPAALTRAVTADVAALCATRVHPLEIEGQRTFQFGGQRGSIIVPALEESTLNDLRKGLPLLPSELAIDTIEWLVDIAHAQYLADIKDFRTIRIEGGWAALARSHLNRKSKKAADSVRSLIIAMSQCVFHTRYMNGNLLAFAEIAAAPHRQAMVTLSLGDMLLPRYTFDLSTKLGRKSLTATEACRLVPILGKAALVGRQNDYGAQRRMVWGAAMLFRDRAHELAAEGSVRISEEDWYRLGREATLPPNASLLHDVRRAWEEGDAAHGIAPLLTRDGNERWNLHDSRGPARSFLIEGAKQSERARARGIKSARARSR